MTIVRRAAMLPAALAMLALTACSQAADPAPEPSPTEEVAVAEVPSDEPNPVFTYDGWIGRWTGVEGMYLDVQPRGDGTYQLEMQSDLDTLGTYTGTSTAEGIAFERAGEMLVLRATDGAATGLKYLDGKSDCLTVREGEGYCRD